MQYACLCSRYGIDGSGHTTFKGAWLSIPTGENQETTTFGFSRKLTDRLHVLVLGDMELANLMLVNCVALGGLAIASSRSTIFPIFLSEFTITYTWDLKLPENYIMGAVNVKEFFSLLNLKD